MKSIQSAEASILTKNQIDLREGDGYREREGKGRWRKR
jgi:hypothetical protein